MRALLIATLLVAACAPSRENEVDANPYPNDYRSALFAIETPIFNTPWEVGKLTLVDSDVDCDALDSRGEMPPWTMDEDVAYVQIFIRHGIGLDGWLRDFPAYEQWMRDNPTQESGDDVSFFWGEMGTGGDGGEPPPVDGREVTGLLGQGAPALDDVVAVGMSTSSVLAGQVHHGEDGETISFAATKCPAVQSTWF